MVAYLILCENHGCHLIPQSESPCKKNLEPQAPTLRDSDSVYVGTLKVFLKSSQVKLWLGTQLVRASSQYAKEHTGINQ